VYNVASDICYDEDLVTVAMGIELSTLLFFSYFSSTLLLLRLLVFILNIGQP